MYIPKAFQVENLPAIHQSMRQCALPVLVSLTDDGLLATHFPLLLDSTAGPFGTLHGHIARANPQWHGKKNESEALVIFAGLDTYVSPNWYPAKAETGRVVPTWNYAAIHAYGPAVFYEDPGRLRQIVTRLTNHHEASFPKPWQVTDAPESFIEGQLKAIVGFEMQITRLEAKQKFNQNRSAADRAGVVNGLRSLDDPRKSEVADWMEHLESGRPSSS